MIHREAVHGAWCGSRTYPTRCRKCGAQVFYFSCNCGCKVFFDSLGWPWPVHDCDSPDHILAQVDIKIEREYRERVAKRQRRRREWAAPIRVCEPLDGKKVIETGVVREIGPVNVYKKFGLAADAPLAPKLLGELASDNFMQATIHLGGLGSDHLDSYTFLVRKKDWDRIGAIQGDLLSFVLVGKSFPGRESYWLCIELSWME
jgi:hypothetical protein